MSRIAVLLPTKGNPDGAERVYRSMLVTSTDADLVLCLHDGSHHDYGHLSGDRLRKFFGPQMSPARRVNAASEEVRGYEVYGMMVDDAEFRTPGWDEVTLRAFDGFPNGIGVVSPAHNVSGSVNFPYISRSWLDAIGWFACPDTLHYCWDTVLEILGESTNIKHMSADEFSIHHDHLWNPQAGDRFKMDAVQFLNWCVTKRCETTAKLREAAR